MLTPAAGAAACGVLFGIVAVLIGVVGSRVDRRPRCSRCGYDLRDRSVADGRCPECGRSLDAPGAFRLGRRRRRPVLIALGIAALVLGGGTLAVIIAGRTSLIGYKPVWLLAWEMNHGATPDRATAYDELRRRWDTDRLGTSGRKQFALACLEAVYDLDQPWRPEWDAFISMAKVPVAGDPRTAAAVDTILRNQGDLATAWRPAWGDRLEWFRESGLLPDQDWARYLRQGVEAGFAVDLPGRIRADSTTWIGYEYAQPRFGTPDGASGLNDWRSELALRIEPHPLLRDGERVDANERSAGSRVRMSSWHQGSMEAPFGARRAIQHDLPPGTCTLEQSVDFTICPWTQPSEPGEPRTADLDRLIVRWTKSYDLPVEVVPESVPLVKMLDDPDSEAAVRAAVKVRVLRRDERGATLYRERFEAGEERSIEVRVEHPAIDVALAVSLREGEREILVGKVASRRCDDCSTIPVLPWPDSAWLDGLDQVDVVLRPDLEAAESQGMTSIWAGELVLPDLKLKRRPFRVAPREEQIERLREAIELKAWALKHGGGNRPTCQLMVFLREVPVALRHRVICRVGEAATTLGVATTEVGGDAFLSGTIEIDDGTAPPTLEIHFEPVDSGSAAAEAEAWAEPIVVPVPFELAPR